MAIFMDTGGGDIYAGQTKEEVIAAMLEDCPELDVNDAFEVSGSTKMRATDENEAETGELVTLDEEYCESLGTYCIASENC